MAAQQETPQQVFSNPLKTAAFLIERGATDAFEKGARFHVVGSKGTRELFTHSAKDLCAARDTLQTMATLRGGDAVAEHSPQAIADVRPQNGAQIG